MVDTIRLSSELTEIFKDGQPAASITAQDVRDLTVSVPYLGVNGWQFFLDSQYTSSNTRFIGSGVTRQITIDGLLETTGHPVVDPAGWDVVENKVVPGELNSFGFIRLAITAYPDLVATSRFDIEFDTGSDRDGSPELRNVIYQQTSAMVKGFGPTNAQSFNFVVPVFVGPDFLANGGTFYVTPDNPMHFYQFAITITQTYVPHPSIPSPS